jgi:hypothetical protein
LGPIGMIMGSEEGSIIRNFIVPILLNIMFHAVIGRFQLELVIFITYFSTVIPFSSCFLSCRPFVVNATFSTGISGQIM